MDLMGRLLRTSPHVVLFYRNLKNFAVSMYEQALRNSAAPLPPPCQSFAAFALKIQCSTSQLVFGGLHLIYLRLRFFGRVVHCLGLVVHSFGPVERPFDVPKLCALTNTIFRSQCQAIVNQWNKS